MVDKVESGLMTGDDLLALPMGRGERYELIEGELIVMSPAGGRHGAVTDVISGEIYAFLKQHKLGRGLTAETGFYTRGDNKTVRAPDYAFIRNENIPPDGIPSGYLTFPPDFVIVTVSPNDKAGEVEQKIREWLDFGVRMVWVIYPDSKRVYVYRKDESHLQVYGENDTLNGQDILPGFSADVRTIFAE